MSGLAFEFCARFRPLCPGAALYQPVLNAHFEGKSGPKFVPKSCALGQDRGQYYNLELLFPVFTAGKYSIMNTELALKVAQRISKRAVLKFLHGEHRQR